MSQTFGSSDISLKIPRRFLKIFRRTHAAVKLFQLGVIRCGYVSIVFHAYNHVLAFPSIQHAIQSILNVLVIVSDPVAVILRRPLRHRPLSRWSFLSKRDDRLSRAVPCGVQTCPCMLANAQVNVLSGTALAVCRNPGYARVRPRESRVSREMVAQLQPTVRLLL